MTNACPGLKDPDAIKSTQLRKHIATIMQLLNLKKMELDSVANFLGHNIDVHRQYYRLQESTIQLAKVCKVLLNMERGNVAFIKGLNLDEISVDDEVEHEEEVTNVDEIEPKTRPPTADIEDEDGEDHCDSPAPPARTQKPRHQFSHQEIISIRTYFKNNIKNKQAPKQEEVRSFLQEHPSTIVQNWKKVKDHHDPTVEPGEGGSRVFQGVESLQEEGLQLAVPAGGVVPPVPLRRFPGGAVRGGEDDGDPGSLLDVQHVKRILQALEVRVNVFFLATCELWEVAGDKGQQLGHDVAALRLTVTSDCELCGCLFHLGQSLFRQVQAAGLAIIYRAEVSKAMRDDFHALIAVAFVPEDVEDAFDALLYAPSSSMWKKITSEDVSRRADEADGSRNEGGQCFLRLCGTVTTGLRRDCPGQQTHARRGTVTRVQARYQEYKDNDDILSYLRAIGNNVAGNL
ncbi:hypothetical protein FOCC_FOCC016259 [Frankliniella occidentalis]|nr:hypothetical protein FOCC_FOCC016259 [Frankliniella occidentalis]